MTVDDCGVFFTDFDTLCLTEFSQRGFFKRHAGFFRNNGTAGEDGDVFKHCFTTITKTRRFHSGGLEDAANVVHNQSCQGFAFDVFCHDQQWTARLSNLLKYRQQITDVADFLVIDQNVRIFQRRDLLVWVIDEVRRQIAAVKLHTLDHIELVFKRLTVFNGDDAFFANFVHCVSNDLADREVAVSRDRTDLSDFFGGGAWLGELFELFNRNGDSFIDAALEIHWIDAGSHVLQAFDNDRLSQHGCRGGAVTCVIRRLGSNFLDQLSADVFEFVFEFDFFSNRHAVFGDGWCAERTLEHDVAALRTESGFYCVGEDVHATDDTHTCVIAE